MQIWLSAHAREDLRALRELDPAAHARLLRWLERKRIDGAPASAPNEVLLARGDDGGDDGGDAEATRARSFRSAPFVSLAGPWPIRVWPISEVHRAVFMQGDEHFVLLQCRYHF